MDIMLKEGVVAYLGTGRGCVQTAPSHHNSPR